MCIERPLAAEDKAAGENNFVVPAEDNIIVEEEDNLVATEQKNLSIVAKMGTKNGLGI